MEKIKLVEANSTDWSRIFEFEKASKSKYFAACETQKAVKDYLAESNVFFVTMGAQSIGTVSYKKEKKSAQINGLTILPDHRGKGYAKIAMDLIMEKIRDFERIYLHVHPKNSRALVIYLKDGFQIIDWEKNHFGDHEPRLLMEKIQKK